MATGECPGGTDRAGRTSRPMTQLTMKHSRSSWILGDRADLTAAGVARKKTRRDGRPNEPQGRRSSWRRIHQTERRRGTTAAGKRSNQKDRGRAPKGKTQAGSVEIGRRRPARPKERLCRRHPHPPMGGDIGLKERRRSLEKKIFGREKYLACG